MFGALPLAVFALLSATFDERRPLRVAAAWVAVELLRSPDPANVVMVKELVADLTIPESNLAADHDGDGISTLVELREGTDPLVYDTDRDGLHDGVERRLPFDANDPDTDDDGISDRDKLDGIVPGAPALFWEPEVRAEVRAERRSPGRR